MKKYSKNYASTNKEIRDQIFAFQNQFNSNFKLICGDTYKVLQKMYGPIFDLIITSPPYNVGKEYEVKQSIEKYLEIQEKVIEELVRLTTDEGSICWQVGNYIKNSEVFPLDIYYYNIFKKFGMKLRNRIIWHFGHGLHASKRFSGRYETILWFTKSDEYLFNLDDVRVPAKYPGKLHYKGDRRGRPSGNPLGKNPSDVWNKINKDWDDEVWEIPNVKSNHPEKTPHPCQYPVELVERCVIALTHENSWVLDPYAGVGSTIIASLINYRNCVGIEKEKEYLRIAKERIKKLQHGNLRLRPIEKQIHKPSPKDKVAQIPKEWL